MTRFDVILSGAVAASSFLSNSASFLGNPLLCATELATFASDVAVCFPNVNVTSSASSQLPDITGLSPADVACLCKGTINSDITKVVTDCDSNMASQVKPVQRLLSVCGAAITANISAACLKNVETFASDVYNCIPSYGQGTLDPLDITPRQVACLCSGNVATEIASITKTCDPAAADQVKPVELLLAQCSALTGISGGGTVNTTTTDNSTISAPQPTSIHITGVDQATGQCKTDIITFANDLKTCLPNAIDDQGNLNLNVKVTPNQKNCLCKGTLDGDAKNIMSSCAQVQSLVNAAKQLQGGLQSQCSQSNDSVKKAVTSIGMMSLAVITGLCLAL
ncbi:hypothetical protein HDU76_012345 [Blyttiomyces sp. JEL0837]|nr:hypothetical protein HDU76_012345 [Blyttiomyces sp. JEL0837]